MVVMLVGVGFLGGVVVVGVFVHGCNVREWLILLFYLVDDVADWYVFPDLESGSRVKDFLRSNPARSDGQCYQSKSPCKNNLCMCNVRDLGNAVLVS